MKTRLTEINHQNLNGRKRIKDQNSGKLAKQDIWFIINSKGYLKSVSPSLLDYLEGMESQFFDALFERAGKKGLPSPVEYLTEMIDAERESVFVKKVLKRDISKTGPFYWNMYAEGSILKFILSEAPTGTEADNMRQD